MKKQHRKAHAQFWLLATPVFIVLLVYAALFTRQPPISTDALHDSIHHQGGDLQ